MVLGSPGKKIQTVVELAEELYEKVNEVRSQVAAVRDSVEATEDRVARIETELESQGAVVRALAEEHGIDPGAVVDDGGEGSDSESG